MKKIFLLVIVGILLVGFASATYCCEKTKVKDDGTGGAWCMNEKDKDDCDTSGGLSTPAATSCESTSYCELGCCFNNQEGSCSRNTAKKTCQENGGSWEEKKDCSIPQCARGCCVLGNKAEFITQTECNWKSSLQGLNPVFRTDVGNEIECVLSGNPGVKGACVFEKEYIKTCNFITREECENKEAEFHQDVLCTDGKLGTNCIKGKNPKTRCDDGQVYFIDSCGNLANIYDASKVDDADYWSRVYNNVECGNDAGNKNSATCGDCEYILGSTCGVKRSGDVKPKYGDYLCRDLKCKDEDGNTHQHGDKWCATEKYGNKGVGENLPGSRHFVYMCYDGEITIEECDDGRAKVCIESEVNEIPNAQCVANKWADCFEQTEKRDCENKERRYCSWVEDKFDTTWSNLKCVPEYAPGFNFWEADTADQTQCSLGTINCEVKREKKIYEKGYHCESNCHCEGEAWKNKMNEICVSLGDCGSSVNYLDKKGWNDIDDLWSKI